MKKILILTGYDYSIAYRQIKNLPLDLYCIYPEKDDAVPESLKNTFQEIFKQKCFEISYTTKNSIKDVVEKIQPDVLISLGWRRIIGEVIFDLVPLCINVHPAILPQYKGYHPVPYVLKNNEKEHGITAHIMTNDLDSGDIICKKTFPISKFSTLESLQYTVNQIFPDFLEELLKNLMKEKITFISNDNSKTKIIAPRRTPEDSELDSNKPLSELYDEIRACDQKRFPAYFFVNGERVYIQLSRGNVEKNCLFDI